MLKSARNAWLLQRIPKERVLNLFGLALVQEITEALPSSDDHTQEMELDWCAKTSMYHLSALFKRAEVETLARKMNGEHEQPEDKETAIAKLNMQLRSLQWQMYTEEKKAAESEHNPTQTAEINRLKEALAAANARAEQAEKLLTSPTKLTDSNTGPENMPQAPALGITFTNPTKSLRAAHAASLKYWSDYDPERPPLQKNIAAFIRERGLPERQATALAIAIKPDDLRD